HTVPELRARLAEQRERERLIKALEKAGVTPKGQSSLPQLIQTTRRVLIEARRAELTTALTGAGVTKVDALHDSTLASVHAFVFEPGWQTAATTRRLAKLPAELKIAMVIAMLKQNGVTRLDDLGELPSLLELKPEALRARI